MYETVIGLEIHVRPATKSKMFCSCSNEGEDEEINTTVCPICMGHPGTLPVANKKAIEWTIKAGLALNCEIPEVSKFDRKNYFYPDLPKGYQISQYDKPIAKNGYLNILTQEGVKKIGITRVHLEEDAAKLIHPEDKEYSVVDFNRAGTPLMEIVTRPELRSAQEAGEFLRELRLIVRALGISDGDMEKGHLRCDPNVSLRDVGESELRSKVEIKNLNSFKAVERGLEYEIKRLAKLFEEGKYPKENETRGFDDTKGTTFEQRAKEEAEEYRYFPEPDIPPLHSDREYVERIRTEIPELPQAKRQRFMDQYEFSLGDAKILTGDFDLANYTEEVISELKAWLLSLEWATMSEEDVWKKNKKRLVQLTGNWLINKLGALVNEREVSWNNLKITPENFAEFVSLIFQNKISSRAAQDILLEMFETGKDPSNILEEKGLSQIEAEEELEAVIDSVLSANQKAVEDFKKGKENAIKFLVGQVIAQTRGRANPTIVEKLIKKRV